MKFNEFATEEKVRLDPKCWTGKKIGNPKTKVKGGVRVNNCVPAESLNEFAPDAGGGESGRWYTDDQMTDIVGDGWYQDLDLSGANLGVPDDQVPKKWLIQEAQAWLEDHGYNVHVLNVKVNDDDCEWFIEGSFQNNRFAKKGMAEDYDGEYDDEAGMAQGSLHTLQNAVEGLQQVIDAGDNLPEWCQEKISLAEDYLVTVWDYLQSEKAQGVDPELMEEFDLIENIIEGIAAQNGVDAEMVWEDLESLTEDELYAFAVTSQLNEDWQKANKRDKTDGMSQKAVNAYRRENPGSKLKTAVTTKPGKLKKGSKASKRRKSYCSRSRGQMKMHNISCAKTPDKAICKARRRWNC
jgi:hypothetical protein